MKKNVKPLINKVQAGDKVTFILDTHTSAQINQGLIPNLYKSDIVEIEEAPKPREIVRYCIINPFTSAPRQSSCSLDTMRRYNPNRQNLIKTTYVVFEGKVIDAESSVILYEDSLKD